jgi:hypothetical protein
MALKGRRPHWRAWQVLALALASFAVSVPNVVVTRVGGPGQTPVLTASAAADPLPGVWFASQAGLTTEDLGAVGTGTHPPTSAEVPCGDAANPVAINATGTQLIAGITDCDGNPKGSVILDLQTMKKRTINPNISGFAPIAFAMDPTHPTIVWAVETNICADCGSASGAQIFKLDLSLNPPGQTPWATLPNDGSFAISPSSAAIAPDGKTLFVGWGDSLGTTNYGVDSVPLDQGQNPPVAVWSQPGTAGQNGPPTPNNSENGSAFADVTDVAVSPDGSKLFVAAVSPEGPAGASGVLYELSSTLGPASKPLAAHFFIPPPRAPPARSSPSRSPSR